MTSMTVTGVSVLDKAMALVSACESRPRSTAELAEDLELPLPTTHRLVRALRAHDLLTREGDGTLRTGARFHSSHVEVMARRQLRDLAEATGETVQLWVPRGDSRLCRISISSRHPLRAEYPEGTLLPLALGGTVARVLGEEITTEGWAETIEETTTGLSGVSAPVRAREATVAVVCVVAPTARVRTSMGLQFGAQLMEATRGIQRALDATVES